MKEPTIRIILCKNQEQLKYYFLEMLQRVKESHREFSKSQFSITDGEDKYIFITPDEPQKVMGFRIGGYDEVGSVYEHEKYNQMIELLESRIF